MLWYISGTRSLSKTDRRETRVLKCAAFPFDTMAGFQKDLPLYWLKSKYMLPSAATANILVFIGGINKFLPTTFCYNLDR